VKFLGKIIKEGISISFAEVHLSQGEESGLLLDDVMKYVLAIASFDAAPLRTVIGQCLEQTLGLILVLKDTPKNICHSCKQICSYERRIAYFPVCSSS
jgi:hypothetical protein